MKYNHALFLNPYVRSSAISSMMLFPPTGLEYVATNARDSVGKITLLDLRYEKELSVTENLLNFIAREIDFVCVGISWDRQIKEICDLLNLIPPGRPLVVGGYQASEKVEEFFRNCPRIDIIVRGEGEETIKEVTLGQRLKDILGISYRENEKIIHNSNRPLPDVDTILPPDRSLRRSECRLMLNGINVTDVSFDTVLSSRGCPFNCKFCTFSLNPLGQKRNYSARRVELVVDEIEKMTANAIIFSDENFFVDTKRAEKICDLIISRRIKKRFVAQARIEVAQHPKLLDKMVKAGFKTLLIGIESPHDRILAQLNKGFDSKAVREAFAVLRKYPLYCHGYFIYGNIGETESEMLYIAQFAKEIGVDSFSSQKLRIEKFSPLKELALNTPGYHVTSRGELYSDTYSHAALKKIGRRIKFSFYTPSRYLKMLWKGLFVIKFFSFKELISLLFVAPRILYSVIAREIEKSRLKDTLRRLFIKNN